MTSDEKRRALKAKRAAITRKQNEARRAPLLTDAIPLLREVNAMQKELLDIMRIFPED